MPHIKLVEMGNHCPMAPTSVLSLQPTLSQDTPGYGDELDVFRNLKMVQDFIELQNKK